MKWSESGSVLSNSVTPWTIQSMEFFRPEYWSGQPFPSPVDFPNLGIEPRSPELQSDVLAAEPQGKPWCSGVTPNSFYIHSSILRYPGQGCLVDSSLSLLVKGPQACLWSLTYHILQPPWITCCSLVSHFLLHLCLLPRLLKIFPDLFSTDQFFPIN